MFQVTVYNFATGVVSNLQFDRLCAARENLEKQVAGFRSANAAQAKTFFTASILDCKSGKYHGFVQDAPPALELKTE